MITTQPLFTGTMLGKPLRFVPAPGNGPRFPWVVANDLATCLSLNRNRRRVLERLVHDDTLADAAMVIRLNGKPERCISHSAARGIIDAVEICDLQNQGEFEKSAAISHDIATSKNAIAYGKAAARAMDVLTEGLSLCDTLAFVAAAFKAENGSA